MIGGIIAGVFTATEASAIAVLYTVILSMVVYREVKVADLPDILINTAHTTVHRHAGRPDTGNLYTCFEPLATRDVRFVIL